MAQGLLIIVSGPSGVGKGTICKELVERRPNLKVSISCTTRERRRNEEEGVHYFYKTEEEFNRMVMEGQMLEHAYVHGHQYGTPKAYVVDMLEKGYDVLLEIDVQGSIAAMKSYPDAVTVFVLPPDRDQLRERLMNRATETPEQIALRLRNAELELFMVKEYQYCVINDKLEDAVDDVEAILDAEHCKVSRGAQSAAGL
jgi:guanylate kinase